MSRSAPRRSFRSGRAQHGCHIRRPSSAESLGTRHVDLGSDVSHGPPATSQRRFADNFCGHLVKSLSIQHGANGFHAATMLWTWGLVAANIYHESHSGAAHFRSTRHFETRLNITDTRASSARPTNIMTRSLGALDRPDWSDRRPSRTSAKFFCDCTTCIIERNGVLLC